jgi:uncharacterized protein YndB with AHSA1/START domain
MGEDFIARAAVLIRAPRSLVWGALTTPEIIKQYFFGVEVLTDWQVGSPILYRGEWQGQPFEDKGVILKFEPEKTLVSTHWSPLSGVPDLPENYHTLTYELSEREAATQVRLTQDNNASQEEREHSEQNWNMMLGSLKKLLEG